MAKPTDVQVTVFVRSQRQPPAIRMIARRFGCGEQEALDSCESADLNVNVGYSTPSGEWKPYDSIGDYTVEDWGL